LNQLGRLADGEPKRQQFTLVDIFAVMTVAASVLAIVAPLLRSMDSERMTRLVLPLGMQLVVIAGSVGYAMMLRYRLMEQTGNRLGIAYFGTSTWRQWPVVRCILTLVALSAVQILLGIGVASRNSGGVILLQTIQLAFLYGQVVTNFLWRVYPGTVEFFEQGVVTSGRTLTGWSAVEVRESGLFPDRLTIVLKPIGGIGGTTMMAMVDEELRGEVLRHATGTDAGPR